MTETYQAEGNEFAPKRKPPQLHKYSLSKPARGQTHMIIFVAGVFGAGKTTLCALLAEELGYATTSASVLIRQRRGRVTWNNSKETYDIHANQKLLVESVNELRNYNKNFILDGHFALLDSEGYATKVSHDVFYDLNLDAILLIEDDPANIALRLNVRDAARWSSTTVEALMTAERENALAFHRASSIPLKVYHNTLHAEILTYLTGLKSQKYDPRIKED
ncbi:AAA family ATPase [Pseudomonas syringae]|uniref:AAA family ATPase n=1 Tax=Pseudomonas syringae TaxID=317 RepID=UPI001BCD42E6|nr:AAA family ATPase [Pseudomonas syringae]MBS7460650.1 AAA family ATPase [Pseudomonas syringae]